MLKTKIFLLGLVILTGACAEGSLSKYVAQNQSTQTTTSGKLKACSMEEAAKMIENGKAFTQSMSSSADQISNICIKKLALQAAGLDNQATSDATNALQTLMNSANNFMNGK